MLMLFLILTFATGAEVTTSSSESASSTTATATATAPVPPSADLLSNSRRVPSTPLSGSGSGSGSGSESTLNNNVLPVESEFIVDLNQVSTASDGKNMNLKNVNLKNVHVNTNAKSNAKKGMESFSDFNIDDEDLEDDEDFEDFEDFVDGDNLYDDDYYDDEDEEYEEEYDEDEDSTFVLPDTVQDELDECPTWAAAGECNANPKFMLSRCLRSCTDKMADDDFDLLAWGKVRRRDPNETLESCYDEHHEENEEDVDEEGCEDWATEGLCKSIDDQPYMLDKCAYSCMVCISPE